jgi:hypothetical protein
VSVRSAVDDYTRRYPRRRANRMHRTLNTGSSPRDQWGLTACAIIAPTWFVRALRCRATEDKKTHQFRSSAENGLGGSPRMTDSRLLIPRRLAFGERHMCRCKKLPVISCPGGESQKMKRYLRRMAWPAGARAITMTAKPETKTMPVPVVGARTQFSPYPTD